MFIPISLFLLEQVVSVRMEIFLMNYFIDRVFTLVLPIKGFLFFFLFIRYFLNCSFLILFPARMEEEKDATNAQILWSACTALARAIKSGPPGAPIEKIVRPLESEIKAVCKAARKYNLNSICGTTIINLVHLLYFNFNIIINKF